MLSLNKFTEIVIKHYTSRLNIATDLDIRNYLLHKVRHTYGVLSAIQRIMCIDDGFTNTDPSIKKKIEISAILHDIGRFYQFEGDRLLKDKDIDHGEKSYQIAKEEGIDDIGILLAIRYHNKYKLDNLMEKINLLKGSDIEKNNEILLITNILRDADKLQNLEYMLFSPRFLDLDKYEDNGSYSENMLENLKQKKQTDYHKVKTKIDMCMIYISRWFDFNFKGTIQILKSLNFKSKSIELIKNLGGDDNIINVINDVID